MDVANKTEKIAAPSGKHDDYCDSSVIGIHATLSMLPSGGTFGGSKVSQSTPKMNPSTRTRQGYSGTGLFTTKQRRNTLRKPGLNV